MKRLREYLGKRLLPIVFGAIFATLSLFSFTAPVAALPEDNAATAETTETVETTESTPVTSAPEESTTDENTGDQTSCFDQVGEISWLVCPTSGFIANIVDTLYAAIENFLVLKPLTTDENAPIRIIWEYARNLSNIVFVIFILIIVYSQVTGLGLSNYGIKRMLPRIVIAAILVNISFFICSLAVDVSNVLGAGIHGLYNNVAETVIANGAINPAAHFSVSELFTAIAGGGTIAGLVLISPIGPQLIFMLMPVLLGILVSVAIGLFTISLRQAIISLLVMVAPLAFVAYLMPNTEKWFDKWRNIFSQMIIFYPMFALLFWAARLAGWALITSANSWLGVILGVAVQIAPLFLALSLMKMSGTVLGAVSSKLGQWGARATGGVRGWSDAVRENRRQRYYSQSKMPYARLQRYLDYRNQLRNLDTENAKTLRAGLAMERAQREIAKGYDPSTYDHKLRQNRYKYARLAKRASTASLAAKTAALDTGHVIEQYGDFYDGARDQAIAKDAANQWVEYNRAEFTRISDEESGFDFLVDKYINEKSGFMFSGENSWQYRRYITSAAGKRGATGVMGQLIAHAAAVEQRRRRDDSILLAKYGYDKIQQRSMMVGYYIDDDGYATDKNGSRLVDENNKLLESRPGELLARDPSKLVLWDTVDENGRPYYNWHDQDGNFLMRIYKDDSAFTKEVLSNYDITIGDPINDIYAILSGNKDREIVNRDGTPLYLKDANGNILLDKDGKKIVNSIGLAKYSTTIQRAFNASGYKSNAAYAGPMAAQSIGMRHIKNYVHLNVERLDNLVKSVKPGNFNTQNPAEIDQLAYIMNPANWDVAFAPEFLEGRVNVNGKPLKGIDEEGKDVPAEAANYEQKMRTIKQKYLFPAAAKMTSMMSRITQQVLDNQKPGAADAFNNLVASLEAWQDKATELGLPALPGDVYEKSDIVPEIQSPYIQKSNFTNTSRKIAEKLMVPDQDGTLVQSNRSNRRANRTRSENTTYHPLYDNVLAEIQHIYNNYAYGRNSDVNGFLHEVVDYLDSTNDYWLHEAANDITAFSIDAASSDINDAYDQVYQIVTARLAD